jgi:hypothetical protein
MKNSILLTIRARLVVMKMGWHVYFPLGRSKEFFAIHPTALEFAIGWSADSKRR